MIVGLTGGIGSGKSTVAKQLASKGIHVVDADLISHQLTQANQSALSEIAAGFGPHSLCNDGTLNRAWLRERIHASPQLKDQLEAILHPKILAECQLQLQNSPSTPYQVLMVPLLIENKDFKQLCDKIITVESEQALRIQRVMQRNKMTYESVVAIINNQLNDQERRQEADFLIYNDGSFESLERQVDQLDLSLREHCNSKIEHPAPQL